MTMIDIAKVTKSFDHLAETESGRNTLLEFREAIEGLRNGVPKAINLNDHEFLAVLQKLVLQMKPESLKRPGSKDGSLSDAQLDNVAGGVAVSSSMFDAKEVTRLGSIRSIGNLGFNIMIVA
jgi:hypothetical protein